MVEERDNIIIKELIQRYIDQDELSEAETRVLRDWMQNADTGAQRTWIRVRALLDKDRSRRLAQKRYLSAAAAIILVVLVIGSFYTAVTRKQGPAPGIAKNKEKPAASARYDSIGTGSREEKYLTLPDGTQVWLNNASSLSYPATFSGAYREVSLSGQADFEVTQNSASPFRIILPGNASVVVLGTSFCVRAYKEEHSIWTTLRTGSVMIQKGAAQKILQPGDQARTDQGSDSILVRQPVDLNAATAWRNNDFHFDGLDLRTAMGELGRWYNMEMRVDQSIAHGPAGDGCFQRSLALKTLLKDLTRKDLHFRVNDDTIIVTR